MDMKVKMGQESITTGHVSIIKDIKHDRMTLKVKWITASTLKYTISRTRTSIIMQIGNGPQDNALKIIHNWLENNPKESFMERFDRFIKAITATKSGVELIHYCGQNK